MRARLNEARLLWNAEVFIQHAGPLAGKTMLEIDRASRSIEKRNAFEAIFAFDQSISVARRDADQFEYKLIDRHHRQAVLADEYAARSWEALIDGPVNQIAAYHGAGIKPEELAKFIQGLGALGLLGYVAVDSD